jgi:2-iminobutanoate/2-iminopropanoate deaminase
MGPMNEIVQPSGIASPAAAYAHAVLSTSPARVLHSSGVVPTAADGSVPDDLAAQCDRVWANLEAIVIGAGMTMTDVVSVTTYVVPGQDLSVVMAARDRALGGHLAASTLVIVAGLAQPVWKVEISLVVAR